MGCWSYLYLNQQLFQGLPAERQALVDAIARELAAHQRKESLTSPTRPWPMPCAST